MRSLNAVRPYIKHFHAQLGNCIHAISYEELFCRSQIPLGNYIFADIERLTPNHTADALDIYSKLKKFPQIRILNNPVQSLRRFDLLRLMYKKGINPFNIYRLSDGDEPKQYPIFIRIENDHAGPITDLIYNESNFRLFRSKFGNLKSAVAIEFINTSDKSGIFKKYSCMIFGDEIIPKHLIFSKNWVCKTGDIVDPDTVAAESAFIHNNPHKNKLRKIFKAANIQYGRIDYGLMNGSICVWEINTHPDLSVDIQHFLTTRAGIVERACEAINTQIIEFSSSQSFDVMLPNQVKLRNKIDFYFKVAEIKIREMKKRGDAIIAPPKPENANYSLRR